MLGWAIKEAGLAEAKQGCKVLSHRSNGRRGSTIGCAVCYLLRWDRERHAADTIESASYT